MSTRTIVPRTSERPVALPPALAFHLAALCCMAEPAHGGLARTFLAEPHFRMGGGTFYPDELASLLLAFEVRVGLETDDAFRLSRAAEALRDAIADRDDAVAYADDLARVREWLFGIPEEEVEIWRLETAGGASTPALHGIDLPWDDPTVEGARWAKSYTVRVRTGGGEHLRAIENSRIAAEGRAAGGV